MKYIRGWIGIGLLIFSVPLWCFDKTRSVAPAISGFGMGMISSGFSE